MPRYSSLPLDLLHALWRHGIEGRTVRVPVRDASFSIARRREVLVDLLARAEAVAEEKQDGSPDTIRMAWDTIRAEAGRHGVSLDSMSHAMEAATRDIGRWWSGERGRVRQLRRRSDASSALTEYRRARRHLGQGRDAPGVALDILTLAAESVASAWWKREPGTESITRELLPEAIRLAILRLDACDVRRAAIVVGAKHGLGMSEVEALERDVEAGILMTEAAVHAAGNRKR